MVAAPALLAQSGTGSVRGVVLGSTGDTIPRAIISVAQTAISTTADDHGRFLLRGLPAGPVTLHVRALGHRAVDRQVTVPDGDVLDVVLRLDIAPVTLARVQTNAASPERQRFENEVGPSSITLSSATIATVPAVGEPDVLRAVQLLPGVLARNDFSAGYNVRGGESDQNLILLDGIPIYNPFHLGGLFGMFIDESVGAVQILTGGFPVQYGGRLSSVLDVSSAEATQPGVHGSANASLLSASTALGGALRSGKGSWNVAARRTYADLVAGAVTDKALPYHFQDAELHATRLLKDGGTLALTGYIGADVLNGGLAALGDSVDVGSGQFHVNLSSGGYDFDWGNQVLGLTLQQPIGAGAKIPLGGGAGLSLGDSAWFVQRASISRYATTLSLADGSLEFANEVREERLAGSLRWHQSVHGRTVGYEVGRFVVHYDSRSPATGVALQHIEQTPLLAALYYDDRWQVHPRLLLRYGARAELFKPAGFLGVSPRASAKFFLRPDLALLANAGRYTQYIHGLRNEDVPLQLFDFWIASDEHVKATSANEGSAGVEKWLGSNRFVRVEGFYKQYDHLYEPNRSELPGVQGDEFVPTTGVSYGADLFARQLELGPLSGWLSYSFAVSRRTLDGLSYSPAQDRRHNVNAVASYRTAAGWVLGAHLAVGTGTPYTDVIGQTPSRIFDETTESWEPPKPGELIPVTGSRNGARYPLFHRLDLSASRSFAWRGTVLTPSVQIVNVYNAHNVFTYNFNYGGNPPTRTAISQFPILPTVGLQVQF